MALLTGRGVSKCFGGLIALTGVDFELHQGAVLGLIGPNGAGKTTLFNIISGAISPSSGEILFKGENIVGRKMSRICQLGICRTHQIMRPFLEFSVFENVRVGALFGKREAGKRTNADQRPMEILEFIGLKIKAGERAGNLTIADLKKIELARALATGAEILLLDEVMAGLNPMETEKMMEIIRRIKDLGITIFMIEHVMRAIMNLSDRIFVLNFGEKIAEGTPQEIAVNPLVVDSYLGKSSGGKY